MLTVQVADLVGSATEVAVIVAVSPSLAETFLTRPVASTVTPELEEVQVTLSSMPQGATSAVSCTSP